MKQFSEHQFQHDASSNSTSKLHITEIIGDPITGQTKCFAVIDTELNNQLQNFKDQNPNDYDEFENKIKNDKSSAQKYFKFYGIDIDTLEKFKQNLVERAKNHLNHTKSEASAGDTKKVLGDFVIDEMKGKTQRALQNPDIGETIAQILFDKYYDIWYPKQGFFFHLFSNCFVKILIIFNF